MQEQNAPYVFISYAHADSHMVLPIVQAMQEDGITLWYDNGIEAGSEWPEFIAEKVMNCAKFVLFMSRAYQDSQNCKRELNFAISRKKEILSIFLEDVMLSPGVEMQLGTYQSILRNRFSDDTAFCNSILREPFFNMCRTSASAAPVNPQPQGYHGNGAPQQGYHGNSYPQQGYHGNNYPQQGYHGNGAPQQGYHGSYSAPQTYYNPQANIGGNANLQPLPLKNRYIAALLAIFMGALGIHKFYLGKPVQGVLHLVFCWTYIPAFLGLVEGILILMKNDSQFEQKYKCRTQ